jgi:hypothetical protein
VLRLRGSNHFYWKPDRLRDISTKSIVTPSWRKIGTPPFISLWAPTWRSQRVDLLGQWFPQEKLGNQVKENSPGPRALHSSLAHAGSRMVQGAGWSIHIDLHMGRLSSQVKLTPQSNILRILLERRPTQNQKHLRAKKNAREALSSLYESTFLVWGPTGHVTQSWL